METEQTKKHNYKYNFFKKNNMINRVDSFGNIDKNEFKNITFYYLAHIFFMFILIFVSYNIIETEPQQTIISEPLNLSNKYDNEINLKNDRQSYKINKNELNLLKKK